ncbi:hypothetical protein HZS38_17270 [Xenorhabdus nematophila]|uniref:hypothetical protein n=1 Tax=Xenorhabdus TaxID=626 RepID=UPI00126A3A9C|nr:MULTISPECIES: hypothetical protein [Xenorhabdus]MBA0020795.1 hypothetical protein [Xenorhabdus nematophila]MCB4424043.1 hypothetical protein [Xenorhabdus nematophila]MDE9465108.1 hypothetical protein [Xenorhabdus bovienii]MDE9485573.1 hypothetical protein [Xenorhabdus bovienii]QNJ36448.1 hypothetical protein H8F46_17540 [Xenorhabdus nematophila]
MSQINQSVKVASPLAKSNGQGFASLSIQTLVGCFCQCVCYRPFYGGSGRGGFGLAGGYSGNANLA